MQIRLTLKPGQNGTKKEVRKYGGRLVAVRYRYDEERRLRLKTVEIVEDQLPWVPPVPSGRDPNEPVLVRVGYDETSLRLAVKEAGGRWIKDRMPWQLPLGAVHALGLDQRIVR